MSKPVLHLHPPKTAGSSIITAVKHNFSTQLQAAFSQGITLHVIPGQQGTNATDYMSLSVRNPYQRFTSIRRFYPLHLLTADATSMCTFFYQNMRRAKCIRPMLDFNDQADRLQFILWAGQADWYQLAKGDVAIIRFESLQQDVEAVYGVQEGLPRKQQLDIEYNSTAWTNAFPDQRRLNQFNDLMLADFELFNYQIVEHIDDLYHQFMPDSE